MLSSISKLKSSFKNAIGEFLRIYDNGLLKESSTQLHCLPPFACLPDIQDTERLLPARISMATLLFVYFDNFISLSSDFVLYFPLFIE